MRSAIHFETVDLHTNIPVAPTKGNKSRYHKLIARPPLLQELAHSNFVLSKDEESQGLSGGGTPA